MSPTPLQARFRNGNQPSISARQQDLDRLEAKLMMSSEGSTCWRRDDVINRAKRMVFQTRKVRR